MADGDNEREAIARLYRRAAFGLAPGELDELAALGVDTVIDRLVEPDTHGLPNGPADPWVGVDMPLADGGGGALNASSRWMDHLLVAERPFEEWMAWYWHGHLVSSIAVVVHVPTMVNQIQLFRRAGLGPFPELLRAITIDAAMLRYLDGGDSTGTAPNENYSRELLELFALGVGEYTEEDVRAGARALTGWRIDADIANPDPLRSAGRGVFVAADHDDTAQRYLGRDRVHDVDSVIAAVVEHEACARFVAARFGRAVLGPEADPALLAELGRRFRAADLDLRVLARATLEAVAEGRTAGLVLGPLPWLLAAQRATGATIDRIDRYWTLYDAGHLPLWPPNVSGWTGGTTWLTSSTTAHRYNLAGVVAGATGEDNPARRAAASGDLGALADALGRPEGFGPATREALAGLASSSRNDDGIGVLAVALASPDLVQA
ncbi:MAG: DUF1800 family protein [Acidimicrobiales bacterium]|nr:DUF1800 family protein [Acidimicrobiales bacterium]